MLRIDSREPGNLRFALRAHTEMAKIPVSEKDEALPCGDYWLQPNGRLNIVERKDGQDFCNSLVDGRLFKQFERCLALARETGGDVVLLLEGPPFSAKLPGVSQGFRKGIHPNSSRGALLSLQMQGVLIVQSKNPDDTVEALLWLYRKWASDKRRGDD